MFHNYSSTKLNTKWRNLGSSQPLFLQISSLSPTHSFFGAPIARMLCHLMLNYRTIRLCLLFFSLSLLAQKFTFFFVQVCRFFFYTSSHLPLNSSNEFISVTIFSFEISHWFLFQISLSLLMLLFWPNIVSFLVFLHIFYQFFLSL